jgi:hypothetical protein
MEDDVETLWLREFESFVSHWEQETESIKERAIETKECSKISDGFHRDSDGLLARRPGGLSGNEVFSRLDKLDHKLNSALAMVCYCQDNSLLKR